MIGTALFLSAMLISVAINPDVQFDSKVLQFFAVMFWIIFIVDVLQASKKIFK